MIWDEEISFEGLFKKANSWNPWFEETNAHIGNGPIEAQYALDLIYKTLIDDHEHHPYLSAFPQSVEQINGIMLDEILWKYSRKYRDYVKKRKKRMNRKDGEKG